MFCTHLIHVVVEFVDERHVALQALGMSPVVIVVYFADQYLAV